MGTYTLNKGNLGRVLSYYKNLGRRYVCHKCGEQFKEGDRVKVVGNSSSQRKHYHQACYDSTLY